MSRQGKKVLALTCLCCHGIENVGLMVPTMNRRKVARDKIRTTVTLRYAQEGTWTVGGMGLGNLP